MRGLDSPLLYCDEIRKYERIDIYIYSYMRGGLNYSVSDGRYEWRVSPAANNSTDAQDVWEYRNIGILGDRWYT